MSHGDAGNLHRPAPDSHDHAINYWATWPEHSCSGNAQTQDACRARVVGHRPLGSQPSNVLFTGSISGILGELEVLTGPLVNPGSPGMAQKRAQCLLHAPSLYMLPPSIGSQWLLCWLCGVLRSQENSHLRRSNHKVHSVWWRQSIFCSSYL